MANLGRINKIEEGLLLVISEMISVHFSICMNLRDVLKDSALIAFYVKFLHSNAFFNEPKHAQLIATVRQPELSAGFHYFNPFLHLSLDSIKKFSNHWPSFENGQTPIFSLYICSVLYPAYQHVQHQSTKTPPLFLWLKPT